MMKNLLTILLFITAFAATAADSIQRNFATTNVPASLTNVVKSLATNVVTQNASGASQTPWAGDIAAAFHSLTAAATLVSSNSIATNSANIGSNGVAPAGIVLNSEGAARVNGTLSVSNAVLIQGSSLTLPTGSITVPAGTVTANLFSGNGGSLTAIPESSVSGLITDLTAKFGTLVATTTGLSTSGNGTSTATLSSPSAVVTQGVAIAYSGGIQVTGAGPTTIYGSAGLTNYVTVTPGITLISNIVGFLFDKRGFYPSNATPSRLAMFAADNSLTNVGPSSGLVTAAGAVAIADTDYTTPTGTETLTGKTYDASASGNVFKMKGYIQLKNFDNITGAKPNNTNDYTASTFMKPVFLNGTAATANFIQFQIQVPTDFDTAVDPKIRITDKLTAGDTGVRRYIVSTISPAASAAYDGTVGTAINVDIAADASGASGDVEQSTQVTLTGWGGVLTAGRHWVIQIGRDGNSGTDTSTVDSMFSVAEIEYGISQ